MLTKIKRHSAGFTLVEILIVLVVILILAALLFPTFNRVREGARRSSCTSNLKQLGLAFLQYSQDHNNRLPVGKTPPPNEIGNGWAGAIFPYVKAPQLFRCPSDSGVDGTIGTVSYAYNQAIPRGGGGVPTYTSTKRLMNPSRTVLLCEVSSDVVFDLRDINEDVSPTACGLSSIGMITNAKYATGYLGGLNGGFDKNTFLSDEGRHAGVANYLLSDGSVRSLRGERVSPGRSASLRNDTQSGDTVPYQAAGTENPNFAVTFSPR